MKRRLLLAPLLLIGAAGGCRKPLEKAPAISPDLTRPAAEWLEEESVRLLRDYLRIDTSEPNGEEEGARFLERIFECDGIPSEIVCPRPGRCNLLARLSGRRQSGALLLLNHIDVAKAFADFWKGAGPFEGKIQGGFLYGRGAYDMKSLAIAQALALRSLKRHGIVPESDVLFLAEADEETGQRWGSRWLLEHRPEWFAGVTAVLNEGGTNEMIVRDVRFWGVETVQAGHASGEFESSQAEALAALARRWPRLHAPSVAPHPHVVEGFDLLANHLVHPLTDPLRHLDRVRRNPRELAALPDRYGSFLEPRLSWSPAFPYPPRAEGNYRSFVVLSVPPGTDPTPFLQPILEDAARAGIRVAYSFSSGPAAASPYRTVSGDLAAPVALLKRVTEVHWPGIPFGPVPALGGYTTSILFRRRGFPAYGYTPIPMNITDAARKHSNDERVYLRDYVNGVALYADILEEFALVH